MPVLSSYTAASAVTDDDILIGNDGSTTKKFPATVLKTYVNGFTANRVTVDYTLALTDASNTVEMNSATAKIITVPLNSVVAFPTGTVIELARYGAGTVTISAAVGVTIRSAGNLFDLRVIYSTAAIRKIATDEWWLSGDLA